MAKAASHSRRRWTYQQINEVGLLVIIALLYLGFWISANNFITFNNQITILRDASFIGIAAWGATLVIISGEIDISVGPTVAFISVIFAYMLKSQIIPLPLCFLFAILLGGGVVGLAGLLRAYFDVPSFIATLGLWSAFGGLALYMTQAIPVSYPSNVVLDALDGRILGIPAAAIIMLALCALFIFISRKTVFGRAVYAIGGNATAAHLAGIKVARVRVLLFVIAGMCSALTAILITARNGIGDAGLARSGMEFDINRYKYNEREKEKNCVIKVI